MIHGIRNKEQAALKTLIKKYESQVAAAVIGMIGPGPQAEDIGQEVFLRFFRNIDNFRGESSPGTYLTRIAINLSINEIRRRQRERQVMHNDQSQLIESYPSGESTNPEKDLRRVLEKGIRDIPSKFRSVIVLRLIAGYTTEETAKILRLPVGTVLSRLARGQMKLREALKGKIQFEGDGNG